MTRTIMAALAATAIFAGGSAQAADGLSDGVYSPRTDAPTLQLAARRYTCIARSRVAVGYWTAPTLAGAKLGALRQCAVRTARGLVCLVVSCS